ncbi:MAG: hypothetical protein R3F38_19700 [Gammaproteobacteria bacterium]
MGTADFGCTMQLSESFRNGYFKVLGAALMDDRDTFGAPAAGHGLPPQRPPLTRCCCLPDALLSQIQQAAKEASGGDMGAGPVPPTCSGWPVNVMLAQAEQDPVENAGGVHHARPHFHHPGRSVRPLSAAAGCAHLPPHLVGPASAICGTDQARLASWRVFRHLHLAQRSDKGAVAETDILRRLAVVDLHPYRQRQCHHPWR